MMGMERSGKRKPDSTWMEERLSHLRLSKRMFGTSSPTNAFPRKTQRPPRVMVEGTKVKGGRIKKKKMKTKRMKTRKIQRLKLKKECQISTKILKP